MPGVFRNPTLQQLLQTILRRVRALESQQSLTITNAAGQVVMQTGAIVQSNGSILGYGTVWYNPASGTIVMFQGVDASGVPRTSVYDQNGQEQTRLGELDTSPLIYGLGVWNNWGSFMQLVTGSAAYEGLNVSGFTNTSWVQSAASQVTATIGPSGCALVTVQGTLTTSAGSISASVGCYVDGVTLINQAPAESSAGSLDIIVSNTSFNSGFTPGVHTFELAYIVNGGSATLQNGVLIVTPV